MFASPALRLVALPLVCLAAVAAARAAEPAVELFNGRDLTGWVGDTKLWTVEDGAITGRTSDAEPIPYNKFLIWQGGTVRDFELSFKFRIVGGNSGVQYRSKHLTDAGQFVVGGYQADIDPAGRYMGILYEERGRGILAERGQKIVIGADGTRHVAGSLGDPAKLFEGIDPAAWNDYTIRAAGNHLTHTINGRPMVDVVDHQVERRAAEGILALQIHRGPAMTVQYKELKLTPLTDTAETRILSPEETPIPEGAAAFPPPKPPAAKPAPGKQPAAGKQPAGGQQPGGGPSPAGGARAAAAPNAPKRDPSGGLPLASAAEPAWIWADAPPGQSETVYFRREFTLPAGVNSAKLFATCDNGLTVYLDGQQVLSHDQWESVAFKDVTEVLTGSRPHAKGGRHLLAVKGVNRGGPAGLLVKLVLESSRGQPVALVTDGAWLAHVAAGDGWTAAQYDTAAWRPAKVVGPLGGGPWTAINATTLTAGAKLRPPEATPVERIRAVKGFRVERLYSVPQEQEGSWVNLCVDPRGRLIVSDQYGGLFRVTPPEPGAGPEATRVEPIPADIGEAQGLLWAFDALYVVVNRGQKYPSGLYRVRDSNGDDQLDQVELLRALDGGGEHGPHAVLLSPDGQSLVVVCGNGTKLVQPLAGSRVPLVWGEDHLLPRMPDGRGFMAGVLAPGGAIYRVDREGRQWELISTGFRNQFDAAYNRQGQLFTYDADMEWDLNTPWYRPTRVCHVTSGSEWGWRNGAGKWPAYYADSLPPTLDIGPGSPTGVAFGYGARFPAKYQEALFICDWSYGKLYAVHLEPSHSTYTAVAEEFVTGTPLPLTDVVVRPQDGALYFTIGGRRVQSGLYRVTYTGDESTAPVAASADTPEAAEARALRARLESFHGRRDPAAIDAAWAALAHPDRFVRFAARVALEHQDPAAWRARALAEPRPAAALTALLGLVRATTPCPLHRKPEMPPVDATLKREVLDRLEALLDGPLAPAEQLDLARVFEVAFNRLGPPDEPQRARLAARFEALFPSPSQELNAELSQLLVYLAAPQAAVKLVAALDAAPTQEEQMEYARSLRMLKTGWTPPLRERYFRWFLKAAGYRGGASFGGFMENIRRDAVATLSDEEKLALRPILEAKPASESAALPVEPRPVVKQYTFDELAPLVAGELRGRDFDRGRQMFAAARCFACHRFDGQGGAVGPDLTGLAGRFNPRDVLESIVLPSKVISDQYSAVVMQLTDGRIVTGRIVNLGGDSMRIMTDMFNPDSLVGVDVKQIEFMEPSKVSMMPEGLLNVLRPDEIQDLMAYLLSRGDRTSPMFAPARSAAAGR